MRSFHFYTFCGVVFAMLGATVASAQTTFINCIEETGINFVHELDGTCSGPPVGSGSAWADYDNDGDIDFYITNHGGPSGLFRNEGDTSGDGLPDFVDVAPALGVDEADDVSHGVCFADYDNDGDQDLYITHWGGNTLYQNRLMETGSAEFLDVTATAGVGDADRCLTAAWADYDQDGWLDLYLAKHFDCMPNIRESRDHLFKNNGDGTFTDVSHYLCSDGSLSCEQLNNSHAFSAGWFDLEHDGDLDLYIASDVVAAGYPNILWRNDGPDGSGGWLFTDISADSYTDYSINCMGLGIGDYDNDGFFDLAFSHAQGAFLLRNLGDGTFDDRSDEAGTRHLYTPGGAIFVCWGTVFFDFDNDQWLDLFYVGGMISAVQTPQPDVLFWNNHDGTFTDVSAPAGIDDDRRGRSASICDFDEDGFVDLFVGNFGWPTDLWHNQSRANGNNNHWLTVTVEGMGAGFTNRDGIGTKLMLTTPDGITQLRHITSGPTHGGGDHKAAWFGLGTHTTGDLTIIFPTGETRVMPNVAADQQLHITEAVTGVSDPDEIASGYKLSQNYPNPFNPTTVIQYSVPTGSDVSLKVYDALGREVATLVNGFVSAGSHTATLDASSLASGMYVYRLTAGSFTDSKQLVLVK
jgi:hypothetical protein